MAAPARRIFTLAIAARRCPIEDAFDPAAHRPAVSGFCTQIGSIAFMTSPTSTACTGSDPKTG